LPINAALRGLGVKSRPGEDEFASFGLGRFRSNDAVIENAFEVDRPRRTRGAAARVCATHGLAT
jgi:hypothetical protein